MYSVLFFREKKSPSHLRFIYTFISPTPAHPHTFLRTKLTASIINVNLKLYESIQVVQLPSSNVQVASVKHEGHVHQYKLLEVANSTLCKFVINFKNKYYLSLSLSLCYVLIFSSLSLGAAEAPLEAFSVSDFSR